MRFTALRTDACIRLDYRKTISSHISTGVYYRPAYLYRGQVRRRDRKNLDLN